MTNNINKSIATVDTSYGIGTLTSDGKHLKLTNYSHNEEQTSYKLDFYNTDDSAGKMNLYPMALVRCDEILSLIKKSAPVDPTIRVNGQRADDLQLKATLLNNMFMYEFKTYKSYKKLSNNNINSLLKESTIKEQIKNKLQLFSGNDCQKLMKSMPHIFDV